MEHHTVGHVTPTALSSDDDTFETIICCLQLYRSFDGRSRGFKGLWPVVVSA